LWEREQFYFQGAIGGKEEKGKMENTKNTPPPPPPQPRTQNQKKKKKQQYPTPTHGPPPPPPPTPPPQPHPHPPTRPPTPIPPPKKKNHNQPSPPRWGWVGSDLSKQHKRESASIDPGWSFSSSSLSSGGALRSSGRANLWGQLKKVLVKEVKREKQRT